MLTFLESVISFFKGYRFKIKAYCLPSTGELRVTHREPGTPHLEYGFWQKNVELLLLPIVIAWQDYVKGVSMWGQCFLLWRLVLELEMLPHVQEKKQMASPKSYERNLLLTC